ncbi:geranylgeranyl transferase type II alpha subunit [Aspergillus japonicus CBS 114.51]|uniref:Geranylgeranyl transferase type-2 subunit alpha n=2 Tax=Aspergillus TaxID=5052 RepID=A0A2V5HKH2_ASPV1|nr:geranylgeranyl transferase type II alpha subunit [Aspergillus japonicus CBS 114.51]PYI22524.1 geranylgeranyl transferase type II alpha subunit [Aspergillus violaceofuscus CBS 115571]RAH85691.1 geranylgeranyl transferase type II alpha subunit [Aspergillus japonicus CBS 114.51]
MTEHGIPRYARRGERTEEARQQELRKIEKYRELEQSVREKVAAQQYTPETLQKISELLSSNPEYYTIWNYRRQVLRSEFSRAESSGSNETGAEQIASLIKSDLLFLIPLLKSFPKCYWIWNYRVWLLDEAKRLLPASISRRFWQEELGLVGKMLNLDSRNFHGWGYRRFVIETLRELKSAEQPSEDMTQAEFDYAKKMIGANLSNFSAWHYRTKLIQRLLNERSASDEERRKMLDDELELVHRALCDPYDQSLWFYHQNLMCVFDPMVAAQTMAPNLSDSERLEYLRQEIEEIEDMLDGAEDCKYLYQALIDCTLLAWKVEGITPADTQKRAVLKWLAELKKLDPLRQQRWLDFEQSLAC